MILLDDVTITRCPSLAKAQRLAGEWVRYEHHGEPLSPCRASVIAGELQAIEVAHRNNARIPKDWAKAHPSYRYQLASLAERIIASDVVAKANALPCIWIEPR